MTIPFVDLKQQYARLKPLIDANIQKVLDHGGYILGPEVAALEAELADFAGVRHCIGVSSGTDALVIALMAKGIGRGDAVFVPAFTYTATAEAILCLGAAPVFVDVDPVSFNIDTADLERRIAAVRKAGTVRPRAVIPVDLFGLPADYDALTEIARAHDLFVLADAAQSFGAQLDGRRVGSLAPVTATSFFPAKPLGCYGDGGAVFTDDPELAAAMRSIRAHGQGTAKYDIVRLGMNGRLDTIQAAVLLAKLTVFEDELEKRNAVALRYTARLGDTVTTPTVPQHAVSAWAQYTIKVRDREAVQAALKAAGIPTAVYYPRPMHLQTAYADYGEGEGSMPVSEALCGQVLSLPMHPYLGMEQVDRICDTLIRAIPKAA